MVPTQPPPGNRGAQSRPGGLQRDTPPPSLHLHCAQLPCSPLRWAEWASGCWLVLPEQWALLLARQRLWGTHPVLHSSRVWASRQPWAPRPGPPFPQASRTSWAGLKSLPCIDPQLNHSARPRRHSTPTPAWTAALASPLAPAPRVPWSPL